MNVDLLKDKAQREALQAIKDNKGRGVISVATGVGKSRVPILYIKDNPQIKKIALVVPTEILRDINWKKEFSNWDEDALYDTIDRYCYASIGKIRGKSYDLVILDECHHITAENFSFFQQNLVKDIIGLTATYPKSFLKRNLLEALKLRPVYTINLDEATEKGLVAPFKIKVLLVELNNTVKNIEAGNSKNRFYQTERSAYNYIDSQIRKLYSEAEEFGISVNREKLKVLSLRRARFIYNLRTKTLAAKNLLLNVIDKSDRVLIFCGSINQAQEIHYQTFHSKTDRKYYELFKKEKINWLSCVNSLNEGDNISNLDKAVIVQVNSNDLSLIQRIGRIIRKRPGHEAEIYIICAKNTQDEVWLEKSLESFNKSIVEYIQIKS